MRLFEHIDFEQAMLRAAERFAVTLACYVALQFALIHAG